jgi:hypothetical protein
MSVVVTQGDIASQVDHPHRGLRDGKVGRGFAQLVSGPIG